MGTVPRFEHYKTILNDKSQGYAEKDKEKNPEPVLIEIMRTQWYILLPGVMTFPTSELTGTKP